MSKIIGVKEKEKKIEIEEKEEDVIDLMKLI